jgi:transposase
MTTLGSRVELFAAIRRDARAGLSNRALQRKHGVGYRTVAAALQSAWPEPRKKLAKRGSRLDPYKEAIDNWLRADLDAPRKQRHTAKRIFDRLLDEHDAQGVVSYGMVRGYVATRRREVRVEAGHEPANAFVPQEHLPGREAEVDFGEVTVRLRGELVTCTLFCLRLSYSGKADPSDQRQCGSGGLLRGAMPTPSTCWVVCRRGRFATTTSRPQSRP